MMRQYELVERVAAYNPQVDEDLLNRAYVYAMQKHGAQKRASGDPYFSHPLEVAGILTDLKLDDASIVVGLLHDTIEDTTATRDEISTIFGDRIAGLVDGLTKIKRLDLDSREAQQAENLRKLLLAVSDDVRVLLVKLADRLHNMRTIDFVKPEKRARIAEETMEIYAPLAGRMGMQSVRDELEDCAFRVLNPEAYKTITEKLLELSVQTDAAVESIKTDLQTRLKGAGMEAEIIGRQKRPFSIFSKMQRKSIGFEQLSDIFAFRMFVETQEDCYQALGIVHTAWPMVPGRFKDYISTPKQNEYRSIHTTIIGPEKQRAELQIRTYQMNAIAEYGIAAHPLYKDEVVGDHERLARESKAYAWLRHTVEHIAQGDAPEEFLEHTKLELFQDQVFCFTPKGRLIALPRGATAIDFAYAVHTDVGDTCIGAKVNGKLTPLVQPLENGDEVEIIRSDAQRPPPAWEQIVVTGKARAAIRRATRSHVRQQYSGLGRHILQRTFETADQEYRDDLILPVMSNFGHGEISDLLAAIGRGDLKAEDVLQAVYPDYANDRKKGKTSWKPEEGWFGAARASLKFKLPGSSKKTNGEAVLPVRGVDQNMPVSFSPEGGAVPGDRIVGILTPGEGVTIYPIQSPSLSNFEDEPERWIDVRWDIGTESNEQYPARIKVSVINEPGSLAEIASIIGASDANIDNLRMIRRAPDFTDMEIDLEVWDLKHLNRIIQELRSKSIISNAARVNG